MDTQHRDSERWRRIDDLFTAALERAPKDRPGFLAAACGDDPALYREVEALLAADSEAREFLEAPAAEALGGGRRLEVGTLLGPYRLERVIGCGGMGTVFEAVRDDDVYRQQVAVKVLNPGGHSASLVRRFHSERQILATLDHPSIARLRDGGTGPDGRPYQVMELIHGLPIDEHCDRHRLTVRQRLELFRKVCSAVHYAHQNLVVHRDIKPSNVLVTEDGEPKLLDFGIAKLLAPESFPGAAEVTVTGLRPMTPHYASPEQVCGGTITTVSDVYSLGVVLYQLLTGRLPHHLAGLTPSAVDRLLTEGEPAKPSSAVLDSDPGSAAPAAPAESKAAGRRGGLRPQQLARRLAGDLDNIVLKALAKEPSRRYGSAAELAEDLRRHSAGLPVVAGHATLGYRLAKLLRRNKLAVGVAALFLALVVAFALTMAWQAAQTARQRDLAELERANAEQVSRFLVDLFKEVDPMKARGGAVTTREVLERGAEKVDRELRGQPEVRSRLLAAIGNVYHHLGLLDDAEPLLESALESRRALPPPAHLEVAESLDHLGALYLQQGRYAEAQPLLREAFEIREERLAPDHPDLASSLRNLAVLHRAQGKYDTAEPLGRRALEVFRRALGPRHPEVALSLRELAAINLRRGENRLAELAMEEALEIDQQAFGDDHPRIGDILVSLGRIAKLRDHDAVAEEHLRQALEVYRLGLPEAHPKVANSLYELGDVIAEQGRLAEAEPLLERSLEIRRELLGVGHPACAESLRALADLRRAQGRPAAAEELFRRALAIWERHPRNDFTQRVPGAYAALLRSLGREVEAAAVKKRAAAAR